MYFVRKKNKPAPKNTITIIMPIMVKKACELSSF